MLQSTALKSYLGGLTGADLDGDAFELALDRLPTCIGYVDGQRRYRYVNAKYRELLGLSLQEIVGRSVKEVLGDDNYKLIESTIDSVLDGQEAETEATIAYPGSGSQRAHFKYIPHADDSGKVLGYLFVVSDVSGAYGVVQALQERESQIEPRGDDRPLLISYCDSYGRILFVNRAYSEWYGSPSEKIVGRHWVDILGMANVPGIEPRISRAFKKERVEFEDALTLRDRKKRHVRSVLSPHIEGQNVIGVFTIKEDLSKLYAVIDAIMSSDGAPDPGVDEVDAAIAYADAEGRYRFVNRAHTALFGHDGKGIVGKKVSEVLPAELYELVRPRIERTLGGEKVELEDIVSSPGGRERIYRVSYLPHQEGDKVKGYVVVRSDVTALRAVEAELRHIAAHDPLTGLVSARQFHDRFAYTSQLADREAIALCVLVVKVGGLKEANETGGRRAGDFVLSAVGNRLRKLCGQGETAARIGSDQFAVLLDIGAGIKNGTALAEMIGRVVKEPVSFGKSTLSVRASVGVALVDRFVTDSEGALNMACEAMRAAKQLGKAYAVYGYHSAGPGAQAGAGKAPPAPVRRAAAG